MRRFHAMVIVLVGLAAGWVANSVTAPHELGSGNSSSLEKPREDRNHARKKQELLEILLSDGERQNLRIQGATGVGELLAQMRGRSSTDEDVARIVAMNPKAAMDQLLTDPGASDRLCEEIAIEWARRDPENAIRYLRGQAGYRAQDCLYQAMAIAYPAVPEKVAEVLKSLPASWQRRNLESLFTRTWQKREAGASPGPRSLDPFADDGHRVEIRAGRDLLYALADDRLRELAESYLNLKAEDNVSLVKEPATAEELDPATFDDGDHEQSSRMRELFTADRDGTIALVQDGGNYEARSSVMRLAIGEFPMDAASWPKALAEVEVLIGRLGVLPEYPPSHFEMGPFLHGQVAAAWIARQWAALQRVWAPVFVETWASSEPLAAVEWARSLPIASDGSRAFQTGMVVWAHQLPLEASEYAAALPAGEFREAAISNVAAAWSCTDQKGAKAWLESLPPSTGKERGLVRVK